MKTTAQLTRQQERWGVALLHQKNTKAYLIESDHTHMMEYTVWKTILQNKPLYIIGIYHPPPGNNITNAVFIDEITELLANRITKYNNMVILGDLYIHINGLSNTDSHIFNDTMQAFGFKQHITSSTHKCGHTWDLIYSEINTELTLHNCIIHGFIFDHTLVTIDTTLKKAPWETTEKNNQETTKLTRENLEQNCTPPVIDSNASLKEACDQFSEELHKMLDRAALQKKVRCADRSHKSWFNNYI